MQNEQLALQASFLVTAAVTAVHCYVLVPNCLQNNDIQGAKLISSSTAMPNMQQQIGSLSRHE